jgi:hypothetical protein
MNHGYISAHDLPARYAAGRLAADEEREFEAHLVDCAECADVVRAEIGLREGLRAVAAERDAANAAAAAALQSPSHARRPPMWFVPAAAAALVVLSVALGAIVLRSSRALQTARVERESLERRAGRAEASAAELVTELAALQQQATQPPAPSAPVSPVAVFALSIVRSAPAADAPINRIAPERGSGLVVLSLELAATPPPAGGYIVTLKGSDGGIQWSGDGFRPSSHDTIDVAIERRMLTPGDHVIELSERDRAGRVVPVTRYPFRVVVL